jgi:Fe-S-cluster-containing hydrogenase component 2
MLLTANGTDPATSLQTGRWFKLICGASYQHIPAIRQLTIAYSLAGADCIDIAADPAIITAAQSALADAQALIPAAIDQGFQPNPQPWLMVSLNDGEDPHFRKAEFDPDRCPADCPQPCVAICPAEAIRFEPTQSGVIDALCYGCGRCLTICPIDQITARNYVYAPEVVAPMVIAAGIDAIEIHTQIGRLADFTRLWQAIQPQAHQLKLLAISCPDGAGLEAYLRSLNALIQPLPCQLLWQTDGRPMSGDIGDGATRACLKLGEKVLGFKLPGKVQLAGGTNASTVAKARAIGLTQQPQFAGLAYGSYARAQLQPLLQTLEQSPLNSSDANSPKPISDVNLGLDRRPAVAAAEDHEAFSPDQAQLWQSVTIAAQLVNQIKSQNSPA